MKVAAVILAAGSSTRFGTPKQLAMLSDGRTMLEAVVDVAVDAGLDPVIAVVSAGIAVPPDVVPEINDAPDEGMSRSLRLGLAAIPAEIDAAVVLLGDQPTLSVTTIRAVVAAHRADRPVVASRAGGRIGPPVLLLRAAFSLADGAIGDEGLRTILATYPELVTPVDTATHTPDVDTPEDLAALAEG